LRYTPRAGGRTRGPLMPVSMMEGGVARTTGGHVITIVAMGATLAGARARALVNAERITFDGRMFRGDIGAKEFS